MISDAIMQPMTHPAIGVPLAMESHVDGTDFSVLFPMRVPRSAENLVEFQQGALFDSYLMRFLGKVVLLTCP